jgi:regulator of protease activity HflC (stomatin/prohibitin superfamily)
MQTRRIGLKTNPNPAAVLTAFFGILLALILSLSVFTIESGTVGVLSTFGSYAEEPSLPGLNFKIPFVQKVYGFDVKMQTAEYVGKHDRPVENGLITKPKVEVLDSKNLQIGLELTVQFTPIKEKAKWILSQYGDNYFDKLINPLLRDIIRDVVANYQAEEIAMNRAMIATELNDRLMKKFADIPFILNGVQLRNIELPGMVRKKIEDVQLAKQEEQRLAMVEKQQEQNKKNKRIEAEGEARKKEIEADAKAYQIQKEAEAVAFANIEIAKSITPELIKYESIKRWSGNYPRTILSPSAGGSNGMFFQLPLTDSSPEELNQTLAKKDS